MTRSDLVEVLAEARQELFAAVEGLSHVLINRQPEEEQWSIKQILEHLYLYEVTATKAIHEQIQHGERLKVKEQPIHLTTNRKTKFSAADFSQPTDTFATFDALKEKLDASRKALLDVLATADEDTLQNKALPHPGFKMLSLKQYVEFLGWHEKRHILQIEEVKDFFRV